MAPERITTLVHREREACYAKYLATSEVAQTEDQLWEQMDAIPDSAPYYSPILFARENNIRDAFRFLEDPDAALHGLDTTVPGILIELIPGTNLSKIDPSTVDLDAICINAIHIVNRCGNLNVLSRDVRLENFVVKPSDSEIVMIDFGHCRLRKEDQGDEEWREAKRSEDEEGAVGYVAKYKYGWAYVLSRGFSAKVGE